MKYGLDEMVNLRVENGTYTLWGYTLAGCEVLETFDHQVAGGEDCTHRTIEHSIAFVSALLNMAFQCRRIKRFEQFKTAEKLC